MNSKDLYNAISKVDYDILERSETATNKCQKKSRRLKWISTGAIAACLGLVIGGGILWNSKSQNDPSSLPTLPTQNNSEGAMGFEGIICYDIDEIDNGNPWREDMVFSTLPVFENRAYHSAGEPVGLKESAILERLETICTVMELDTMEREYERNGERVISITAGAGGVTVKAYANGEITINFEDGLTLPEYLHFTLSDTSHQEAEEVMEYFTQQFSELINFEKPKTVLSGNYIVYDNYSQDGNYLMKSRFQRSYMLYEGAGDDMEDLLNYKMNFVEFYPDEEGRLSLIRINDALSCADKLGDYPIITVTEARDCLLNGNYITSVPYEIEDETLIRKVELVYRSSALEKKLMPYYRFYVELPDYMPKENGPTTFGAYYVPAVMSEYISNMSLFDGSTN